MATLIVHQIRPRGAAPSPIVARPPICMYNTLTPRAAGGAFGSDAREAGSIERRLRARKRKRTVPTSAR